MFKEPSFLKKANLFQPILVVVISIIGGTPMEKAPTREKSSCWLSWAPLSSCGTWNARG